MHRAHVFLGQSVGFSAEAVLVESGVGFRTKYGGGFLSVGTILGVISSGKKCGSWEALEQLGVGGFKKNCSIFM